MLMQTLETQFGELWGASAYLTPTESQGLAPHYDDVELFIIQTEGKKEWRLYNFAMPHAREQGFLPSAHSGDIPRGALQEPPFLKVVLEVGDVLYLPRGTVHEARTVQGHVSTHVTVSTYQNKSWGHLLGAFMNELNQSGYLSSAPFRPSLPLRFARDMSRGARVVSSMVEEMKELGDGSAAESESDGGVAVPFVDPARVKEIQESQRFGREQLAKFLRKIADDVLVQDSIPDQVLAECLVPTDVDFCLHRLPPFSGAEGEAPSATTASGAGSATVHQVIEEANAEVAIQVQLMRDSVYITPKHADFTCAVEVSAYKAMLNAQGGCGDDDCGGCGDDHCSEDEHEDEGEGVKVSSKGRKSETNQDTDAQEDNEEEEEDEDEEAESESAEQGLVVVNSALNLQRMHMEEQSDQLLSESQRTLLESRKALVKPFDAGIQSVLAVLSCGSSKAVRMSELPWPITMGKEERAEIIMELAKQGVVSISTTKVSGSEKSGELVSRAAAVARRVFAEVAPPAPPVEDDEDEEEEE
jgi:hypothetical protein